MTLDNPDSKATNTAPLCGSCGEQPREAHRSYCLRCAWRLMRRTRREEDGEMSPVAFDDERAGK